MAAQSQDAEGTAMQGGCQTESISRQPIDMDTSATPKGSITDRSNIAGSTTKPQKRSSTAAQYFFVETAERSDPSSSSYPATCLPPPACWLLARHSLSICSVASAFRGVAGRPLPLPPLPALPTDARDRARRGVRASGADRIAPCGRPSERAGRSADDDQLQQCK
jgi:hypothetical protein